MPLIQKIVERSISRKKNKEIDNKTLLLDHLKKLINLESQLWGTTIIRLSNGEETVLEDLNHLIYLVSRESHDEVKKLLSLKDTKQFLKEIENLRDEFALLKKQIKQRDKLKNLITNYTIKLVDESNYNRLENIFILEKQLYNVLDRQEEEFSMIIDDFKSFKVLDDEKADKFLETLKKIRNNLGGHMDFHELWEEEKHGYSNTSNILHALVKEIKKDI